MTNAVPAVRATLVAIVALHQVSRAIGRQSRSPRYAAALSARAADRCRNLQ